MNENKKWYAISIRPGRERKVIEILNRKKIENYCPFNKAVHSINHRKRPNELLFKSFAFVRIYENEVPSLSNTDGVIHFLFWLGMPAVIHDSEIEAIKTFLKNYASVKFEKIGINMPSGKIIPEIPQEERENKTVSVMLPSLGYLMIAEEESPDVDVIFRNIPTDVKLQAG